MAIPQTEVPQVPKKEQLVLQVHQLVMTRSQLKDQVETIEKQLPVLQGMVKLLEAQEAVAAAAAKTKD